MSVAVQLPALGESVVEGTISRWLVKEGDYVERDQPLVEVTTDKVDTELPAPESGVIEKILVPEGETVQVGAELARIDPSAAPAARDAASREPAPDEAVPPRVEPAPAREPAPPRAAAPRAAAASDATRATPVARRMAEEAQVELGGIRGSGVAGRVTKEDMRRHVPPAVAAPVQEQALPGEPLPLTTAPRAAAGRRPPYMTYSLQPGDRVIPMTPLRKLVAEHMVLSKQVSPHVGTVAEVDLGRIVGLRAAHKKAFQEQRGFSLTYLPFVVHATVRALREFPRLNASVVEDAIVEKKDIHVGVAVETEKGLVVPVVRHADRLSLTGIAESLEDLSRRARSRQLSPDELRGGSFTVSNPGRQGNLYGFAIINQPQVGILRMGEIVKRPVVRTFEGEDAIVIRPIMHLALSYDHRVVDGAPANAFLHRVARLLEEAEFDF